VDISLDVQFVIPIILHILVKTILATAFVINVKKMDGIQLLVVMIVMLKIHINDICPSSYECPEMRQLINKNKDFRNICIHGNCAMKTCIVHLLLSGVFMDVDFIRMKDIKLQSLLQIIDIIVGLIKTDKFVNYYYDYQGDITYFTHYVCVCGKTIKIENYMMQPTHDLCDMCTNAGWEKVDNCDCPTKAHLQGFCPYKYDYEGMRQSFMIYERERIEREQKEADENAIRIAREQREAYDLEQFRKTEGKAKYIEELVKSYNDDDSGLTFGEELP